jgi:leader peptidase (prepilin peptidase)/N-methyltransferase
MDYAAVSVFAELAPAARWLGVVWLAVLGACIGSFMNVVVYRTPRGKSLVHPGSACPACDRAIRWQHNLPVLGWLVLRGRCYDCGARIAPRYPIVEAITAATFAALAWVGPLSAVGAPPLVGDAPSLNLVWAQYALHAFLLSALFCIALVQWDGLPGDAHFPRGLLVIPLLAGLAAGAVLPAVYPVPLSASLPTILLEHPRLAGLSTGLAGAMVGAVLAGCTWPVWRVGPARAKGGAFFLSSSVLAGALLGWQACYLLVTATSLVFLLLAILAKAWPALRRIPWTLLLWCATLVWLVGWKQIYRATSLAGSAEGEDLSVALLAACGLTATASYLTAKFANPRISNTDPS